MCCAVGKQGINVATNNGKKELAREKMGEGGVGGGGAREGERVPGENQIFIQPVRTKF